MHYFAPPLSSSKYPFTLLEVKAPKGKPHAPHGVQDVRNKKDGFLKYNKLFYVFRAFYSFPFSVPLEVPYVVCYAFCAFRAFCVFRIVASVLASWVASISLNLFCMFYRSPETDCGCGSKMTRVRRVRETRKMSYRTRPKKRRQLRRRRTRIKKPVMMGVGSTKRSRSPPSPNGPPQSTCLEAARMAAQPKGIPAKAKPQEQPKSTKPQDSEELSQKQKKKAHGKSPPKKKSKGKGKKKVEEKPKHVHYAVEGEPHKKMPTGATRGEKYQAPAAYDNDVQVIQRTFQGEYDVSLAHVCQHYNVCLAEDAQARHELGLGLLLVTNMRAYSVHIILRSYIARSRPPPAFKVGGGVGGD